MTVLGRGLIFQPVLASLPYTRTCTYNSDTIKPLQNILTVQIFHQEREREMRGEREREREMCKAKTKRT